MCKQSIFSNVAYCCHLVAFVCGCVGERCHEMEELMQSPWSWRPLGLVQPALGLIPCARAPVSICYQIVAIF